MIRLILLETFPRAGHPGLRAKWNRHRGPEKLVVKGDRDVGTQAPECKSDAPWAGVSRVMGDHPQYGRDQAVHSLLIKKVIDVRENVDDN